ncbi:MAG: hypothetical protein J6B10_03565 [Lachnospiraceae bacterium]|nr:hypothetical protein [Lachnospiraceae bacterium]
MAKKDEEFEAALVGKKIPYLTLDNKWHKLFTQLNGTPEVKKCAEELNELLKRQGKLNAELKEIRALKKKLMGEVMPLARKLEQDPDRMTVRKMDEMTRLIEDCNDKIDTCKEELAELPREMDAVNRQLMLFTMNVCYQKLQSNTTDIEQIAEWISKMRTELKKNVVRKQEMEIENQKLYSYMHAIFGPDVINIFDMKYVPETKKPAAKGKPEKEQQTSEPEENRQEQKVKPQNQSEDNQDEEDRKVKIW